MKEKNIIAIGALLCALAVVLGAFGAHGLKETLIENQKLQVYETAVQYHIFHSLAIVLVGIMLRSNLISRSKWIIALFALGLLLFSGSLYILSLSGINQLGIITPFGGVSFIIAWILLSIELWKN